MRVISDDGETRVIDAEGAEKYVLTVADVGKTLRILNLGHPFAPVETWVREHNGDLYPTTRPHKQ